MCHAAIDEIIRQQSIASGHFEKDIPALRNVEDIKKAYPEFHGLLHHMYMLNSIPNPLTERRKSVK